MDTTKMQLEDWLDDLCVRFIINLPQEDLSSVARICFQVEEAQWFYEDFIRPLDPTLPSMSLRSFCLRIFQHCPLLATFSIENHMKAFEEFLQYKTRVPVRGAILLNEAMDSTILVKGWKKGANWSFPRGKINKNEDDLDCAIREVYEETGFDIRDAGLVPPQDEVKYIEITMREQQMRLYVFRNIPMSTHFEPKTRKEISKIQWYNLSELPAFRKKSNQQHDSGAASNANKFYMVAPFLVPLKKWVVQQRKKDAQRNISYGSHLTAQPLYEETLTEDDLGTQTEPAEEPINRTPAIDTLDGATRELQRLLKVQPPTQGVQPSQPSHAFQDKGEALLAILQRSNGMDQQATAQNHQTMPQTPLDLTYTQAPNPHTPRHHHPTQLLPYSGHQQPPGFSLPLQQSRDSADFQHQPLNSAGHMNYGYPNPQMTSPPQQRQEPVPLMHPQPLPPQVQTALFNRGMFPTPGVPDNGSGRGREVPHGHGRGYGNNLPQQGTGFQQKAPPLNQHKMALLSALKGDGQRHEENQYVPPAQQQAPNTGTYPHPQSQKIGWANVQHDAAAYSAQQQMPSQGPPPQAAEAAQRLLGNSGPAPAQQPASQRPVPPSDQHRTALLGMFKQAPSGSPREAAQRLVDNNVFKIRSAEGQQGGPSQASTGKVIEVGSRANGGPVQMNPELNLPFGALSIMNRAKDATNPHRAEGPAGQARTSFSPNTRPVAAVGPNPDAQQWANMHAKATHPMPTSPQHPPSASNSRGYQTMPSPRGHQPQSSGTNRHTETNPEQKQKLLSLFGKPHAAPGGSPVQSSAQGSRELSLLDKLQSGGPRLRQPSHASAGPESGQGSTDASRRGSGTPISPADRSFLLGYLESLSGQPGR